MYSAKVKDLVIVDEIKLADKKTKNVVKMFKDLKVSGKILVVVADDKNENLIWGAGNIKDCVVTPAWNVSVYDLAYFDKIVMDKATLKVVEEVLA